MTDTDSVAVPPVESSAENRKGMRIMLITDAWEPQVNGVVRTLSRVMEECQKAGHEFEVIHPYQGFRTVPLPTYPEIKLALGAKKEIERRIRAFEPDAIHIATEGTLGWAARSLCVLWNWPFTTSYHTKFPEYVHARFPFIPLSMGYAFMRRFHNSGGRLMVATPTMRRDLEAQGFRNIKPWARGVDTEQFHPRFRNNPEDIYAGLQRPNYLNVGRVAVEKNLESFLDLDLPGTRVIVGDGPQMAELKEKYPDVVFTGSKFGDELSRYFADADVFVFPSFTDTFGLVILESMACGTPVAAYVAHGPRDIIPGSKAGAIHDDLKTAIEEALTCTPEDARAYAETYSWEACARDFVDNLEVPPGPERRRFWKSLRELGSRARLRRRKKETEAV